jgi:Zn-dependent peptidase ImmA (M78 family)
MNTPPTNNVISELRKLTPVRPLTLSDAYAIAELEANRLLQLRGVHAPGPVDLLWIRDVPRVRVIPRPRHEMPTLAGFTQWEDGQYKIFVNKNAGLGRRRFTLAHEFGHVINWNAKKVIYSKLGHGDQEKHDRQIEQVTDHFAACFLMPRRFVKQAWTMGIQDIEALAELFKVSTEAMRVRLTYLGLLEDTERPFETLFRRESYLYGQWEALAA